VRACRGQWFLLRVVGAVRYCWRVVRGGWGGERQWLEGVTRGCERQWFTGQQGGEPERAGPGPPGCRQRRDSVPIISAIVVCLHNEAG
jgi:hypothetical protein